MFAFNNFPQLLEHIDTNISHENFLSYLDGCVWKSFSSDQFVCTARKLANVFYDAGVRQGTAVALVADSSPFWLMVDFALQELGAVSVPIFANISKENLDFELEDAEISFMFIASQEKFDQLASRIESMDFVLTLDVQSQQKNCINFHDALKKSSETSHYQTDIDEDDIATIIYTSGSTGRPKGVELTHKNFISQLKDVQQVLPLHDKHIALSFLPLAHIFERMVMNYYLASGICIYFADDVKNVANLIKELKPTLMTVVPRLLDKIYMKMHDNAKQARGIKYLLAHMAFVLADTKPVGSPDSILDKISQKLVYKKLLEALGGRLEMLICGGAPLSAQTERFFTNIGLILYQGYGLSETSPVIAVNTPTNHKFQTTGKALPSLEVKLLADKELAVKGPSVMRGYHKNRAKTAETIVDGWLHTGDLATIDTEGFITITSRKKELFKTSTGKYVSAIALEQGLGHESLIDYVVVVADNRPFVTALIFADQASLDAYASKLKLEGLSFELLLKEPKILKKFNKIVDSFNTGVNDWERIQKFILVDTIPSIDNHILTPSMKVSRDKAYALCDDEIQALYSNEGVTL